MCHERDIKRNEAPISSPVYVRPILRPKQNGFDKITECVPDDSKMCIRDRYLGDLTFSEPPILLKK